MSEARIAQDVLVMKGMSKETLVLLYEIGRAHV